ncbi:MAG: TVP38/TMEM64 family protein [Rhizobiales bacterium]|nr:TVP38/TMEM64 family protein [Hyphomicrobiales bacterium]
MKQPSFEGVGGVRRATVIAGLALLALLLGGIVAFYLVRGDLAPIMPFRLSAEEFEDTIRAWGAWAVVGSLLLMVVHSFVPFPSEFVAIANGMVFGLVIGTAITWVGAMLGAILAFALARWLGRPFVQAVLPARHAAAIDEWTQKQGVAVLLISRFLPVVSFNLINYAAGLTSVSWWTFLWTTGLGIAPLTVLMVFTGEQMMSGRWKLALALIAACVAVSLLAFVIARRRRAQS